MVVNTDRLIMDLLYRLQQASEAHEVEVQDALAAILKRHGTLTQREGVYQFGAAAARVWSANGGGVGETCRLPESFMEAGS